MEVKVKTELIKPISEIRIEEEKLEDYFSELIGGGEIG